MKIGTRIEAPMLASLTRDHDDHVGPATMRGTGAAVLISTNFGRARSWGVEYKCDVCGEIIVQMDTDSLDLVRTALRAQGIEAV
jgi:hypothetical protein